LDEDLRLRSTWVQCSVISSVAAEPGSPSDGDMHRLTGTANAGKIAIRDNGAWVYYTPAEGFLIYDRDANAFLVYDGSAWAQLLAAAAIKSIYESNADTNPFTDAEQTKLAGLSNQFLGVYASLGALNTAHAVGTSGEYAFVDTGIGDDVVMHVWDDDDDAWVPAAGGGASASSFLALTDTPSSFTGHALKMVRVNAGETAVEFVALTVALLTDGPGALTGNGGKGVRVNSGATALEYFDLGGEVVAVTSSRSLALTDLRDILEVDPTSGAVVLTIPTNASVAFPVGTNIGITLLNTSNTLTITAAGGVSLNGTTAGSKVVTAAAFAGVNLYKRDTDAWVIQGQYS
jgi:hypothetical protein